VTQIEEADWRTTGIAPTTSTAGFWTLLTGDGDSTPCKCRGKPIRSLGWCDANHFDARPTLR